MDDANTIFLTQLPVESASDPTFIADPSLRVAIERVASYVKSQTIRNPTTTIGVLGNWGTGKTSAVNLLEAASGLKSKGKHFYRVSAPALVAEYESISAAVGNTVLDSLIQRASSDALNAIAKLVENVSLPAFNAESGSDWDRIARMELLSTMGQFLSRFPAAGKTAAVFQRFSDELPDDEPSLVIVVDDLDRCSLRDSSQLVAAVNLWAESSGLVFILVSSKPHLEESMQLHLGRPLDGSTYSKYLHLDVSVSSPLADPQNAIALLSKLIDVLDLDPTAKTFLRSEVAAESDSEPGRSLNPLLTTAGSTTPRELKALVNRLVPELAQMQTTDAISTRTAICRILWPAFCVEYLEPAMRGEKVPLNQFLSFMRAATEARRVLPYGHDLALVVLERRLVSAGVTCSPDDRSAILYLAALDWSDLDLDSKPAPQVRGTAVGSSPRQAHDSSDREAAGPEAPYDFSPLKSDFEQRVQRLTSEITLYDLLDDGPKLRDSIARLRRDLRSTTPSSSVAGLAASVGNAALRASEAGDLETAYEFHKWARAADPSHVNVLQNYVDFLINEVKQPNVVAEAKPLVEKLETEYGDWKPLRTAVLRLQLSDLSGEAPGEEQRQFEAKLLGFVSGQGGEPVVTAGDLILPVSVLIKMSRVDYAREVVQRALEVLTDAEECYKLIRVFADSCAQLPDDKEALDIYDFLLSVGSMDGIAKLSDPTITISVDADLLHNYATVLYNNDYDRAAGIAWALAYHAKPDDLTIRRTFSQWALMSRRDGALAQAIQEGKEISALLSTTSLEGLPESFSKMKAWWSSRLEAAVGFGAEVYHELGVARPWGAAGPDGSEKHS